MPSINRRSRKSSFGTVAAEEKVERELSHEKSKIPQDPGVYQLIDGKELRILGLAESKLHTDKRRSVLKAVSPIPLVSGKATVEVDKPRSSYNVETDTPEFYIQLSAEQRFAIIRLTAWQRAHRGKGDHRSYHEGGGRGTR